MEAKKPTEDYINGSFVAPVTTTTTPAPLSSSACGQQSTTPRGKAISRIVSGTNVIPNSCFYYGVRDATLTIKDYAITVAQCIGGQNPTDITLFAGMHDLLSSTEEYTTQVRGALNGSNANVLRQIHAKLNTKDNSFTEFCKSGISINPNGFTRVAVYHNWIKSITG
ncbi:unnamed protein product [Adineta ricciae]|uniref:Uncharacterized protein n=1 Tax=Adineta ricciae TaxID=249248 RepID=A0A814LY59_ADIRI|nr:unnamed protein product [Adineta ricciae]